MLAGALFSSVSFGVPILGVKFRAQDTGDMAELTELRWIRLDRPFSSS